VRKHAFFEHSGINIDRLLLRQIEPPFVPAIKSLTDTSNFDDLSDDEEEEKGRVTASPRHHAYSHLTAEP
jgi:hypothetical protein